MKPEHLELKNDLLAAIANKEYHYQESYNCGTSCCIAGGKVIRDFPSLKNELLLGRMMNTSDNVDKSIYGTAAAKAWNDPWDYAENKFSINFSMANLIFREDATYLDHIVAIDLIDLGELQEFDSIKGYPGCYLDDEEVRHWIPSDKTMYSYIWNGTTLERRKMKELNVAIYRKND